MRSIPFSSAEVRPAGDADARTDDSSAFSPGGAENLIPIDPALAGIDPALQLFPIANGSLPEHLQYLPPPEEKQPSSPLSDPDEPYRHSSILDGPQGDPFLFAQAAQRTEDSPPPEPILKPWQRRRRIRCQFCRSDTTNALGEQEAMLTCSGCKKSGHPSCMKWEGEIDRARSWDWKCIECKECEICHEKGDDDRILFCDACDRGWHMDCLNPPLETAPRGKWACPACPDVEFPEPAGSYASSSRHPSVFSEPAHPAATLKRTKSGRSDNHRSVSPRKSPSKNKPTNKKGKQREEVLDSTEDEDSVALDLDDDSDSSIATDSEVEEEIDFGAVKTKPSGKPSSSRRRDRKRRDRRPRNNQAQRRVHIVPPKDPPLAPPEDFGPPPARRGVKLRLKLPARHNGKDPEPPSPKRDPFEGILSKEEADIAPTTIQPSDKNRFDKAKVLAENKILNRNQVQPPPDRSTFSGTSLRATRHNRSPPPTFEAPLSVTPSSPAPPRGPKELRIRTIRFGIYDIDTWYDAPFPEEYSNLPDSRLWYCEHCLKYMRSKFMAGRHKTKCKARHPPGDEIYRDGIVSIFEVDGRKHKTYCQNLCLLSKMFLDHKSLFYDVEPFLFYVITEVDDFAARFVGYFSKEKSSLKDYNVSCIMTLPIRQKQGWGNLLVDFSYLLSLRERRPGSPEKPLSGLGEITYKRYWRLAIMRYLATALQPVTLEKIQEHTAMTLEDIYNTLVDGQMIHVREGTPLTPSFIGQDRGRGRPRKQKLKRVPTSASMQQANDSPPDFVPPASYAITYNVEEVRDFLAAYEAKGNLKLVPEALRWTPYLLTRVPKPHILETGASMTVRDTDAPTQGWQASDGIEQPPGTPVNASRGPSSPSPRKGAHEVATHLLAEETSTPRRLLRSRGSRDVQTSSPQAHTSRSPTPLKRVLRSTRSQSGFEQRTPQANQLQRNNSRKRLRIDSSPENEPETDRTASVALEPPTPITPGAIDATSMYPMNGGFEGLDLVANVAVQLAAKSAANGGSMRRGRSRDHANAHFVSSVGTDFTEVNDLKHYSYPVKQELFEEAALYPHMNGTVFHGNGTGHSWRTVSLQDGNGVLHEGIDLEDDVDADGEFDPAFV